MKNFNKVTLGLMAAASLVVVTGCATTTGVSISSGDGEHQVNFPAIEKAVFSSNNYKGSWPNWSNVAQVEYGMSKDQLYDLLGYPHYREGLYGVKEWNYIFNFRDNQGEHQQCQYQIHFDKNMTTQALYWSSPNCEEQVKNAAKPAQHIVNNIIQQMPAAPAAPKETISLSADALFAFDKFSLNDMNAKGRAELGSLVSKLKAYQAAGDVKIYIVGHTDRLGDESYNLNLSKNRADTVAAYLLSQGIKPASLNSLGAGEYMPVKDCSLNGTKQQQIECLTPNRRVEVQVYVQ